MEIVPNCQCQETSGAPHSARLPTHFLLDHGARRLALALVPSYKTRLTRFQRRARPTWPRYVCRRLRYPRPNVNYSVPGTSLLTTHTKDISLSSSVCLDRSRTSKKGSTHILSCLKPQNFSDRSDPPRSFPERVFSLWFCASATSPSSSSSGSILWWRAATAFDFDFM